MQRVSAILQNKLIIRLNYIIIFLLSFSSCVCFANVQRSFIYLYKVANHNNKRIVTPLESNFHKHSSTWRILLIYLNI